LRRTQPLLSARNKTLLQENRAAREKDGRAPPKIGLLRRPASFSQPPPRRPFILPCHSASRRAHQGPSIVREGDGPNANATAQDIINQISVPSSLPPNLLAGIGWLWAGDRPGNFSPRPFSAKNRGETADMGPGLLIRHEEVVNRPAAATWVRFLTRQLPVRFL